MSEAGSPANGDEGTTPQASSPPAPAPAPLEGAGASDLKSSDERKKLLASAVQSEVVQGARVESQQDYQAVLVFGKAVNNLLHFLVGLFTCGIWWLVWIGLAIFGGEKRVMVVIDEYGNVLRQKI